MRPVQSISPEAVSSGRQPGIGSNTSRFLEPGWVVDCRPIAEPNSRLPAGKRSPCRDVAVVRSLLVLRCSREQNALYTLNPPASPYAIMRRACSLPRREPWTRRGCSRKLDPTPGIREQPRPAAEILRRPFPAKADDRKGRRTLRQAHEDIYDPGRPLTVGAPRLWTGVIARCSSE
jgi:hypothetical protein